MNEKKKAILVIMVFLAFGYLLSLLIEEITIESVLYQSLMFTYLYSLIIKNKEK